MSYSTIDDIVANIPSSNIIQVTDDVGAEQVNLEFVNEAIAYADSLIDGYLKGIYPVPLSPAPKLINKISIDLAIYHLYSRRFELDMPESMMQRYKNSIKILEQIRDGVVQLGEGNIKRKLNLYEV